MVVIDIPEDVVHKRVANRRLCSVCWKPENGLARSSCCGCGGSIAQAGVQRVGASAGPARQPRERCRGAGAVPDRPPFSGIRVDAHGGPLGPGTAVLSNLIRFFTFEQTGDFHVALFRAVWAAFSLSAGIAAEPGSFRSKTGIIGDDTIPEVLYGPPPTNRSSCARRAKPGSERPERASFCG